MSEFKVREVTHEEKSVQEIEQKLLDEHKEKQEQKQEDPPVVEPAKEEKKEIDENEVLSYLNNRYNKQFASTEDLFSQRDANEELPENVASFLKYTKETGRGISDYIKLSRDFEKEDPLTVLSEYMATINPNLDKDDVAFEIQSKYGFDEEFDDEKSVKAKKIAIKKDLSEALKYFNSQKEQYKAPLESSAAGAQKDDDYESFKKSKEDRMAAEQSAKKQSEYFVNKTNELFSKDFKGFGFNIDGKDFVYKPGDPDKIKEMQMNVGNFVSSHLDDKGFLKDASQYHKALAAAMNPDAIAKYFYDQGRADEVTRSAKDIKNIDMGGVRSAPDIIDKGGFKVNVLDDSDRSTFKIRSNKKH